MQRRARLKSQPLQRTSYTVTSPRTIIALSPRGRPLYLRPLLPLRHARQPVNAQRSKNIEHYVRRYDTQIPPAVRIRAAHTCQVGIRIRHRAELAVGRRLRIRKIPTRELDVWLHVLPTGRIRHGLHRQQLDVRAPHGSVGQAGAQHRGHDVREGRDAVHENPEAGQGVGRGEHAAEDERERKEQVGHVAARLGQLDAGDDHVREGRGEEEKEPDQEEHEAAAFRDGVGRFCVAVEAAGEIVR
jgi:hypothetical protein